jgi:mRNA interferase RelE/StbE
MATQLFLTNTANKAQRKLDKPLREKIKQALMEILTNPTRKGERLSQPLSMLYSHHLKYQGKEFRIAYQYIEEQDCVFVVLIAPHENFYKRVKNLVYAS